MDAASAFYIKKALQAKWGDKPCLHVHVEEIRDHRDSSHLWFCLECGQDIPLTIPSIKKAQ